MPLSCFSCPLQLKLVGSVVSGRPDMAEMLQFAADKKIAPLIQKMAIEDVNAAVDVVRSGKVRYRVVLVSPTA